MRVFDNRFGGRVRDFQRHVCVEAPAILIAQQLVQPPADRLLGVMRTGGHRPEELVFFDVQQVQRASEHSSERAPIGQGGVCGLAEIGGDEDRFQRNHGWLLRRGGARGVPSKGAKGRVDFGDSRIRRGEMPDCQRCA